MRDEQVRRHDGMFVDHEDRTITENTASLQACLFILSPVSSPSAVRSFCGPIETVARTDFAHLVAVDPEFKLFTRAWCVGAWSVPALFLHVMGEA